MSSKNHLVRIIPRLDIKGANLVKGVHLEGLRIIGKPEEFAKFYYESGADEILYLDTVASLYGRNSIGELIEKTAKEIFIPLTVGGGIRNLNDVKNIMRRGADRVAINTALFETPTLINQIRDTYGTQAIVASIQAKKKGPHNYECLTDAGREKTGRELFQWVEELSTRGVGEIIVTSVDQDGTGRGFDETMIQEIVQRCDVPVIAAGGAGNVDHISQLIKKTGVNAVCLGSVLHYSSENKVRRVYKGQPKNISSMTIYEIKSFLNETEIMCRMMN